MNQSATRKVSIKWDITVPSQFNDDIVSFLASQGKKTEDLSALVQKALSRYILSDLSREAKYKVRNSGLSQKDLDKIIADSLVWEKVQP